MRYVNDESEAKSILNQGFFKIFKNLEKYNTSLHFKPWLKTIMVNTALDHIKKNKKIALHTNIEESDKHTIEVGVLDKLGFDDLLKIIEKLPVAYRTVFNLFVIDGYKHEEIAEKLNINIGTSKSNLSRAKQKLRSMIRENMMIAQ